MAANWKLVQAFIREATEDSQCRPIADIHLAYLTLRAIQRGHFEAATSGTGVTQISSTIGETSFSFAISEELSTAQIIQIAETALQLIDGKTVAQARALLKRYKTSRISMAGYTPA